MIGASHGVSRMSRMIVRLSFRGGSTVSHIMEINDNTGETLEALQFRGVIHGKSYHQFHSLGTRIDIYQPIGITPEQEQMVWEFMLTQVGKGYDWMGIWGILRRRMRENPDKWFCSELVFYAYAKAKYDLLNNIFACQVTPATLITSTRLKYIGFLIAGQDINELRKVPISQIAKKNAALEGGSSNHKRTTINQGG